jgi:hypothetical protein
MLCHDVLNPELDLEISKRPSWRHRRRRGRLLNFIVEGPNRGGLPECNLQFCIAQMRGY